MSAWLCACADAARQETRLQVALKAVKRDKLSAKLFDNLQSEIQILKSLSHRHVTRLLDIVVRSALMCNTSRNAGDVTIAVHGRCTRPVVDLPVWSHHDGFPLHHLPYL